MTTTGRRTILPISLSPANPDAAVVAEALKDVPSRGRSAAILSWAAAYLQGRALETPAICAELGMTEEEFDAALDAF